MENENVPEQHENTYSYIIFCTLYETFLKIYVYQHRYVVHERIYPYISYTAYPSVLKAVQIFMQHFKMKYKYTSYSVKEIE